MKYIAAIAFLMAVGFATIASAPAFSQVLPLEDVMQTRILGPNKAFDGPIYHLNKSMKPSKDGHAGYEPEQIVVGPAAYATANSTDSNMKYYIDIQTESGFDTIVYSDDRAKEFFALLTGGELKDEIVNIVLIDPADKDYVGDVIYIGGYGKNGEYLGQMTFPRAFIADVVTAMGPAA